MLFKKSSVRWLVAVILAGCGGIEDPKTTENLPPAPKDFGQYSVGTASELCEGMGGLSGDTILAQKVEHIETMLDYITAQGERVNPTTLTMDLTWPSDPSVICYPPYEQPGLNPALARVAIPGLTMTFVTGDGKFDEIIDTKAWLIPMNGSIGEPIIMGTSKVEALQGTFKPPPEIVPNPNLVFTTRLDAKMLNGSTGGIGMTAENPEDINAGIWVGSIAAALWPHL